MSDKRGTLLPFPPHQKKLLLSPIPSWTGISPVSLPAYCFRHPLAHRTSPTATYTLIYAFLADKSLKKTAQALKKEVRDVVVLKDGLKLESPSLEVILQQWKTQEEQKKKPTP